MVKGNAKTRLNYRSRNRVYTNTNVNIIRPDEILLCLAVVYASVCSRINPSHVSMPPNQNGAMAKAKAVCPRVTRLKSNWLDERSGVLIGQEECGDLNGHDCVALRRYYMHNHSIRKQIHYKHIYAKRWCRRSREEWSIACVRENR